MSLPAGSLHEARSPQAPPHGGGPGAAGCAASPPRHRRTRGRCIVAAAFGFAALVSLTPATAQARPMEPVLSRFVLEPSCGAAGVACLPDRTKYIQLVNQLGFALAPNLAREARSNGLLGFDASLLASFTSIDSDADYWRLGTRGEAGSESNGDVDGLLQLYGLELRKGFGFGLEAAGSVAVMPQASVLVWGADMRLALLEGLTDGVLGYLPDVSVGAGLRRATGLGELRLGTLALDARLSRPWASHGGFVLTPWLGYQWLRIDADTTLVDFTPGVSALGECGYVGSNVPGSVASPEAAGAAAASGAPAGTFDGSPLCQSGSGADFASSASFGEAIVHRHRAALGVSYRRELLRLGAEVVTDLLAPDAAQSDDAVAGALRCEGSGASCRSSPRQWTLSVALGASF